MPVDFFLLEAAPEALHVHIVQPAALAVHGDTHPVRLERSGERLLGALHKLFLLGLYPVRVHLETFCEFGQCAIASRGGKGYLRLERRTVGSACAS